MTDFVDEEALVWCPTCEQARGLLLEVYYVRRAEEGEPCRSFEYRYCAGCGSFLDELSGAVASSPAESEDRCVGTSLPSDSAPSSAAAGTQVPGGNPLTVQLRDGAVCRGQQIPGGNPAAASTHAGWFARLRARIFDRSNSVVSGRDARVRVSETPRKEGDAE